MNIVEKARRLRKTIESLSINLDDTDALDNVELFPLWDSNDKSYDTDCRVRYGDKLYRCLQSHVSQTTWTPADSPSLWTEVLIPDPEVIPEWVHQIALMLIKLEIKFLIMGKFGFHLLIIMFGNLVPLVQKPCGKR